MTRRLAALLLVSLAAGAATPGRNAFELRGRKQDIYFYPGDSAAPGRPAILFTPGDGGWRGAAIIMAKHMAAWGYDVYGWDTKVYLTSFTEGKTTLSEKDVQTDFAAVRQWIGRGPVLLVGWSQGAAMSALAAASSEGKRAFAGVLAIGLPETAVLGWRWQDNITYVTKKDPEEPRFRTEPYLADIAPLPLWLIHAGRDEYTALENARKLFRAAHEPKQFRLIEDTPHNFDGHREDFFTRLREGLIWMEGRR